MRGMTVTNPELERAEAHTIDGMAHWAGGGPPGATCGKCANYGYEYEIGHGNTRNRPTGCALFWKWTHRHGARSIPKNTDACKYFEPAKSD